MSLKGQIILVDYDNKVIDIEFTNTGKEIYSVNGEVVIQIKSIGAGKSNTRKIPVEGCNVEFKYTFDGINTISELYVNHMLYKNDVFEVNQLQDNGKTPFVTTFLVIIFFAFILFLFLFLF